MWEDLPIFGDKDKESERLFRDLSDFLLQGNPWSQLYVLTTYLHAE